VFHLAALADIVPSIQNPEGYFGPMFVGTFVMLQAARAAKIQRFVYSCIVLVLRHSGFLPDARSPPKSGRNILML